MFLIQPHHRNYNKRIIKTPKLYFHDTGLASWLLGIQDAAQLDTHSMRGALFETFVISEHFKARCNQGLPGQGFYFWRDRSGNEVDLLIERGEQLRPVEIKSGLTLSSDAFRGLQKWLDLAGDPAVEPTLVYGGDEALVHAGIQVTPWRNVGVALAS